jgi:hypothetical protein
MRVVSVARHVRNRRLASFADCRARARCRNIVVTVLLLTTIER